MAVTRHVALLRGINVGGKNLIRMADLRETFEDHGYDDVRTYIASGNVMFASQTPPDALEDEIEALLEARLGRPVTVVVRSHQQLTDVVEHAPEGFGEQPDTYHSDAIFLKAPLTADEAMEVVDLHPDVDRVWAGTGVLYFARVSDLRTKSHMNRIVGTDPYQSMTIRSWRTTTRLRSLLDEMADGAAG